MIANQGLKFLAIAAVIVAQAAVWQAWMTPVEAPSITAFQSVSLTPFEKATDITTGGTTTRARVFEDVGAIAPYTQRVRTYSATGGLENVPEAVARYGMKVDLGIWLDGNEERNEAEIKSAIDLAKKNASVASILVGNEAILRGDLAVPELVSKIRRVRAATKRPVSTGEVWSTWIEHPELVKEVDYIAAHILPFWEHVKAKDAVEWSFQVYDKLRKAYPGKHIVIAEFGWPSDGLNRGVSFPGAVTQAKVLRDFAQAASAHGVRYNIVEAIDQPWKVLEGSVGPHWGFLDAGRKPKFELSGPIEQPRWRMIAISSLVISLILSLPALWIDRRRNIQFLASIVFANIVGAWMASAAFDAANGYLNWSGQAVAFAGLGLLTVLAVTCLARISEILSCVSRHGPEKLLSLPVAPSSGGRCHKVSIHIPACREPADMLVETLNSVARLESVEFECIVVVNNTEDGPEKDIVRAHCAVLGERFRFIDAGRIAGFKAGAMNVALGMTAPDADIIAVIDADYVVTTEWLSNLVHSFDDDSVGIVQAPQDHRDGGRSRLHGWMNAEYAGFFDVGMVERNEVGAIIVHGTLLLIRKNALISVGGWPTQTICEDTDLGLTMAEAGWRSVYTRERLGHGLLPNTYADFRKQRHRWAFGGVQIVIRHFRNLLRRSNRMSIRQRASFALGWTSWMGSEAVGAILAISNIAWAIYVSHVWGVSVPSLLLTVPLAVSTALQVIHFHVTYAARTKISFRDRVGASLLALSLQSTVAKAVFEAVILRHMPFVRTAKGKRSAGGAIPWFDLLIASGLISACYLLVTRNWDDVVEINAFAVVVAIQSLPFIAASFFGIVDANIKDRFNSPLQRIKRLGWQSRTFRAAPGAAN
jgi:exo-beta-1,3-glucanase (GH17 family)/glycosyltransferase involved in cell wall biosynthesis/energy-converting hydrogenase Eha subunit A